MAALLRLLTNRRRLHGTDRIGISDGRWALSLGLDPGWTRLRLVGGLVQHAGAHLRRVIGRRWPLADPVRAPDRAELSGLGPSQFHSESGRPVLRADRQRRLLG